MSNPDLGNAWNQVVDFFDHERNTTAQVYASEWFFLKDRLKEGMSVLDVGCAQGGFASVMAEHLRDFSYTGIDVSAEMIAKAKARHPRHEFHHIPEDNWDVLNSKQYDVVLVLGILHLHHGWQKTIERAWKHTRHCLILDLREHDQETIEDEEKSCFLLDFGGAETHQRGRLPYILVNSAEALATIRRLTPSAQRVTHFGYLHSVSASARTPVKEAMANVWCLER